MPLVAGTATGGVVLIIVIALLVVVILRLRTTRGSNKSTDPYNSVGSISAGGSKQYNHAVFDNEEIYGRSSWICNFYICMVTSNLPISGN